MLKSYVLLGIEENYQIFRDAYTAIKTNNKRGPWYIDVRTRKKERKKERKEKEKEKERKR